MAAVRRSVIVQENILSANDALARQIRDRLDEAGVFAINLMSSPGGGSCHLDANMLAEALPRLELASTDLLIIENVGNLVCPANFALGAHANIVIASVPEGADKPYKYPGMFRGADVLLLNKIDYLAVEAFDIGYFRRGVGALNPDVAFFPISCRTGEGLEAWYGWLRGRVQTTRNR
jgi:hydrogenase nickel incorporation protein HypB